MIPSTISRRSFLLHSTAFAATSGLPNAVGRANAYEPVTTIAALGTFLWQIAITIEQGASIIDRMSGDAVRSRQELLKNTNTIIANQTTILTAIQNLGVVIDASVEKGFRDDALRNFEVEKKLYASYSAETDPAARIAALRSLSPNMDRAVAKLGTFGLEAMPVYIVASALQLDVHKQIGTNSAVLSAIVSQHSDNFVRWVGTADDQKSLMGIHKRLYDEHEGYRATLNKKGEEYDAAQTAVRRSDGSVEVYRQFFVYRGMDAEKQPVVEKTRSLMNRYPAPQVPYDFNFTAGGVYYNFAEYRAGLYKLDCLAPESDSPQKDWDNLSKKPDDDTMVVFSTDHKFFKTLERRRACVVEHYVQANKRTDELRPQVNDLVQQINAVNKVRKTYMSQVVRPAPLMPTRVPG